MAQQSLRKRRLEEKLGLNEDQTIKSGFDQETMAIVWDIMNKKYDGLLDHPLINYDEQSWPSRVFFFFFFFLFFYFLFFIFYFLFFYFIL